MIRESSETCQARRWFGHAIVMASLFPLLAAGTLAPSGDEILAKIEGENTRRHLVLKRYSGWREYTLENARFGKQAAVTMLMYYNEIQGDHYTVLTRSGSDKLNAIIDRVIASEAGISLGPEMAHHEITADNYRVHLLGTEVVAGRSCYVLALKPRTKSRFLIVGKMWVDTGNYAVVRIDGQFAASVSLLVGAPHIIEDFTEVGGFWMLSHVRSVASTFLLGPTELDILFSKYQFERDQIALQ
jgi:hypothetical protein